MPLLVGTSGWQYGSWRGPFYPARLPQREWLRFYATRFPVVEVNNTFYRLPRREVFERWAQEVPEGFRFALKMSRYLTHVRRLRDPEEPVERFLERADGLGRKLGPVLIQLPPGFGVDRERLRRTLDRMPGRVRVAVEFRDRSWFTDEVRELLEERNAALCLADRRNRLQGPLWRTADWGFVRLHEGVASPWPCYGDRALLTWSERLADQWSPGEEVFVFFNNDTGGCAPRDAERLEARTGVGALKRVRGTAVRPASSGTAPSARSPSRLAIGAALAAPIPGTPPGAGGGRGGAACGSPWPRSGGCARG